jgi:cytidylate kinase
MKKQKVSLGKAQDIIDEVDEGRENYLNNYSNRSRYDTRNYQLVISMDEMTEDGAVDVIMAYIKAMSGC